MVGRPVVGGLPTLLITGLENLSDGMVDFVSLAVALGAVGFGGLAWWEARRLSTVSEKALELQRDEFELQNQEMKSDKERFLSSEFVNATSG